MKVEYSERVDEIIADKIKSQSETIKLLVEAIESLLRDDFFGHQIAQQTLDELREEGKLP